MTARRLAFAAFALALLETAAVAGSCKVENAGPADEWRFVHGHDVDRGEIVLSKAIKSGDSKPVTVSGERVRVDHKTPGGTRYLTGPVAICKDCNAVKF